MLKTMVGHPDPPFGTETFIPKFLSVNCPQPERDAWLKVMAQTPGAAAPNSQLVGQKEDGPKGLAPSPQGGTVLQAVPAAGWRGLECDRPTLLFQSLQVLIPRARGKQALMWHVPQK